MTQLKKLFMNFSRLMPMSNPIQAVLYQIQASLGQACASNSINYFSLLHEHCLMMNVNDWTKFQIKFLIIAMLLKDGAQKYYLTQDKNQDNLSRALHLLNSNSFQGEMAFNTLANLASLATQRSAKNVCNPTTSDCTQSCYFGKEARTGRIVTMCEHSNTVYGFPDGELLSNFEIDARLDWDDLLKAGVV